MEEVLRAGDLRRLLPGAVALASVLWLSGADGGYFPVDWGFPLLGLLAVVVAVVVSDGVSLGSVELVVLAALAALLVWTASSGLWSEDTAGVLAEAERTALYLAALAACLLGGGRSSARSVPAGLLLAAVTVACWSLAPHLLHTGSSAVAVGAGRLAGPLGYWNGLGLVAAIGCVLALAFAAHGGLAVVRAAAAAALVVLVPTLYFTFSRGSWLALAVGLLVLVALDSRRWEVALAVLGALPAALLALVLSAHAHALGQSGVSAGAAHEGHVLALELLALAVLAAALTLAVQRLPRPRALPARLRTAVAAGAVLVCVAAVVAAEPAKRIDHLRASFHAQPAPGSSDLRGRLFSTSGSGRSTYWNVAWQEVRAHPVLGGGAGSYGRYWLRRRPVSAPTVDAHNLYLETLAELGPVGLAALLVALLAPFTLLRRVRREPFVAGCAGAYAAFLVHAALDWDWELAAVGLAGLLCGAPLLLAARTAQRERRFGRAAVALVAVSAVVAGALVFVLQVGNGALAASESAAARDDDAAAVADARRARRWAPWSAQADRNLGEALLAQGDVRGAAAAIRRGIAKDGGDWQLWYDLALTSRGRVRAEALARARSLDPLGPDIAQLAPAESG
jgi:hypothetical protein